MYLEKRSILYKLWINDGSRKIIIVQNYVLIMTKINAVIPHLENKEEPLVDKPRGGVVDGLSCGEVAHVGCNTCHQKPHYNEPKPWEL